jgi:hypothetical protein
MKYLIFLLVFTGCGSQTDAHFNDYNQLCVTQRDNQAIEVNCYDL